MGFFWRISTQLKGHLYWCWTWKSPMQKQRLHGSKVTWCGKKPSKLLALFRQLWICKLTGNEERSHPLKSKCINQHLGQLQCSLLPTSRCWLLWLPDVAILFNFFFFNTFESGQVFYQERTVEGKMLFSQMLIFGLHYRPFISVALWAESQDHTAVSISPVLHLPGNVNIK